MTEVAERTGVALGPGWKSHVVETLALGLPLIGAQLAQNGIHVTDIVIIGRLGTNELAAMVLAAQFYFTIFIFGSGFTAAVVPLAAQAFSQGDVQHVRRAVRMGLWVVFAFSALAMPLIYYAEPVLVAMGQDRHVSALAAGYLHIAGWGMFPALAFMVLRSFLSAVGKAGFVLYVTLVVLVVNAVFAYGLVLGHLGMPALGMTGAAIVALATRTTAVAVIAAGLVSLIASVIFLFLAAPDVAMTEAAIGSGLTTFLFFFVLGRIRREGGHG